MKEQTEKQAIEEIAKLLNADSCFEIDITDCRKMDNCCICKATQLYKAGYRKQSDGKWEGNGYLKNCSECGNVVNFNNVSKWLYKFCPNCGAKMKGGAE